MSTFKCKMCGGSLDIAPNATVIECEYCGTPQTLPKLHDEKLKNMFERADQFRRAKDFDKALEIYEEILTEKNDDSEIYWSIVLCRYGIEYVDDPMSHQKIPTVNRAQFTSIYDDTDYQSAIRYADTLQKMLYEKEAAAINEIQKGILAISNQEEPYDVFICYKETDDSGERTHDSVDATDLYYELTEMGFKVFFSRITLEDKLGTAYEPYIFAALNSAKVMVVIGSKPEYFNAVWVKNEWSRFLALMKNDRKRTLIPAYRNMDAYDLPKEFSHLQALDMSKLGFMSDLTRGIKKIIGEKAEPQPRPQSQPQRQSNENNDTVAKAKSESWYIGSVKVSHESIQKIDRYITNNNKLEAIKYVREISGLGLTDAKNWVENYHSFDLHHKHDIPHQYESIEDQIRNGASEIGRQINYGINALKIKSEKVKDEEDISKASSSATDTLPAKELKKKRNNNIILGIVFIYIFWPVSIFFFVKAHKLNKQFKQSKK